MTGNTSWENVKKEFDLRCQPDITLDSLQAGEYWKSWWTLKDKMKSPLKWRKHKKQRLSHGYSVFDWWSFDNYIAGVIAHACERFASTEAHGYPGDMTWEEWQKYCLDIAAPLKLWASPNRWELSYEDEWKVLYPKVQEALVEFSNRFGSFWD